MPSTTDMAGAAIGLGANIIGGLLSAGKKPKVPAFVPVDAQKEQVKAIRGNIAAFGPASQLAGQVNTFNNEQLQQYLRSAIPGYDTMVSRATGTINSELSGAIPTDVASAINRKAAGRALMGGYAGSGMARNLEARDLGLTSLDLTNRGLSSAMNWINNARASMVPSLMDVTSMFLTPQQQIAHSVNERNTQFERDQQAAAIAAMPDPRRAAVGGALMQFGASMSAPSGGGGGMGDIAGMAMFA